MKADDNGNGNGRGRSRLSAEERLEIERLDDVGNKLQAEFENLYIDYKNLHSRHERAFTNGKELERKYFDMDVWTYRKQWRKLLEEEIVLQELGATVRQYAEDVRKCREEVWQTKYRLMKNGVQH